MKIQDIMTRNVEVAHPTDTVQSIAQKMAKGDFGFMPVCDGKTVIGTITDRDLTIRALAGAKPPSTTVSEVMTSEVTCLRTDDDIEDVLTKMGDEQVRRFPVVDELKQLVGVVSIGDLAREGKANRTGEALQEISRSRGEGLLS